MCGIAGIVAGSGMPVDRDTITRMTNCLSSRGPDACGIIVAGPVAFGHRRLSIIDLSASANQPMIDETGRFTLVYNGEIYNFREVREKLEKQGRSFITNGDSEVLLVALASWGPPALDEFVGMFAFALWDNVRNRLLLGRDRLGKKPLFYARLPDGGIAFASEPRAVALHPSVEHAVDPVSLAHYLQLNYVSGNRTLFRGIQSLPPASYAEFDVVSGLAITRYWDLASKYRDKQRFRDDHEAAEALAALIDDAVRMRLVSDVPLGAFLSGGVDSSTIVASMRQHRDPASIFTFSSGFLEDTYDESPYAARLAGHLGVAHRTHSIDLEKIDLLQALLTAAAEPLADTSMLPTYLLSQFTRRFVTVALSGDGGDECFAGYETYVADKLHRMAAYLPASFRRRLPALAERLLPINDRKLSWPEKLRRFFGGLALDAPRAHASWRDIGSAAELRGYMRREWCEALTGSEAHDVFDACFAAHFDDVADCDPLDQMSYVDIKTWLVDDVLVKVDRASMAHSLEVRCPLLDHRIVEFAARLPADSKLRGFRKKYLLKRSQAQRLPVWVLNRRKRGFNAPISRWLRGPLRELGEDVLSSEPIGEWFERDSIRRLWQQHQQLERDNGLKLFGLVTLGLFLAQPIGVAAADQRAPDAASVSA